MKKLFFACLFILRISAMLETESNWKIIRTIVAAERIAQSFAFDRHDSELYSISERPTYKKPISKKIEIFATDTGNPVCDFNQEGVNQVAFSPKDKNIVAVSTNSAVTLWDINKMARVAELSTRIDSDQIGLDSLAFDRVGEQIVAGCCAQSKNLFLFDPRVGHAVQSAGTASQIYGVTFLNDENRLIQSLGSDAFAFLTYWDLRLGLIISFQTDDNFLNVSYAQGCDKNNLLKERCNSTTGNGTLHIVDTTAYLRNTLETVKVDGVEVVSDDHNIAFNSRANMILYKGKNGSEEYQTYLLERDRP